MTANTTFRTNLRTAMKSSPMLIKDICRKAGYDPAYVRKVVSSNKVNPSILFAECMANAVGIKLTDLLQEKEDA